MNLPTRIDNPGAEQFSVARAFGERLRDELKNDPDFYLFSPDETTSNRLDAVFESTSRAWALPTEEWDKALAPGGHVIEMLSENTLFGVYAGHVLSGGRGAMTSYESFFTIISSQLDQHLKFLKQAREVNWRPDYSAINLLSTSCWQRQDHNGYSHQNPSLISSLLVKPSNLVNCFFPIDDISAHAVWDYARHSQNCVNLITFNKNPEPRWIDTNHAKFQLENGGASVFGFATDEGEPDLIISGIGDIPSTEALEAIKLIKTEMPQLKIRYIGIVALSYNAIGTTDNKLPRSTFDQYFGQAQPIIVNFHGYPDTIRNIFAHYCSLDRVSAHGYEDQGSTTTPLDELSRNRCSRYDLCADAFARFGRDDLVRKYQNLVIENASFASQNGYDKF